MMGEDLRLDLMVSVADVVWHLVDDGIDQDTALADAMSDTYRISLWALPGWSLELVGLCPATLFRAADRWQFECDVLAFLRGEWHDVGPMGSWN